jgi:hypothetical protein
MDRRAESKGARTDKESWTRPSLLDNPGHALVDVRYPDVLAFGQRMLGRLLHTVLEAHKRSLRLIGGFCDIFSIEHKRTKAVRIADRRACRPKMGWRRHGRHRRLIRRSIPPAVSSSLFLHFQSLRSVTLGFGFRTQTRSPQGNQGSHTTCSAWPASIWSKCFATLLFRR